MKNLKIGNVTFTAEGVCTNLVPYSAGQYPCKEPDYLKFHPVVQGLIRHRIQHCSDELEANLHKATYVSDQVIVWEGGHFSVPTFEMMKEWLEKPANVFHDTVTQGIAQQALRQMFEEKNFSDKGLFYYLTERILFE